MSIEKLKQGMVKEGAIDPVGVHHEFKRGKHGRKIDFEVVEGDPELFEIWVAEVADFISSNYEVIPDLLVSVANGTNRLTESVATKLGIGFALTEKVDGIAVLSEGVTEVIHEASPDFALVLEDIGTTGYSSNNVAQQIKQLGAKRVEVLNSWQRMPELIYLIASRVAYKSLIVDYESVATYEPEDCQHCRDNWELKKYRED
jgi:orotate phosphoribosyltransferase